MIPLNIISNITVTTDGNYSVVANTSAVSANTTVPVKLHTMAPSTTVAPMMMVGIVPYIKHGCDIDGEFYMDGAQVRLHSKCS